MKQRGVENHSMPSCYGQKLLQIFLFIALFAIATMRNTQTAEAADDGFWEYSINRDTATITKYTGGETDVVIPSVLGGKPVTCLGYYAFTDNPYIVTVTIPSSVEVIERGYGQGCFGNCKNLSRVDGLENISRIGAYAFRDCGALRTLSFGNKLTTIESGAFMNCASLGNLTFPSSLTSIGEYSFSNCDAMTDVTVPLNVTSLSWYAFQECDNLKKVSLLAALTEMSPSVFRDCKALTTVEIGPSVSFIGEMAFYGCSSLVSLNISDGISSFGDSAFSNCSSLEEVTLPNSVRTVSNRMFLQCTSLSDVKLSYGLLTIQSEAFNGCSALTSIELPKSLVSIEWNAFSGCPKLTDVFIPNSVTSIGDPSSWSASFDKNIVSFRCYGGSYAEEIAGKNGIPCTILDSVPSDSFSFDRNWIDMKVGQKLQVGYAISPVDTTDAIVWESSDPNIISVNGIGEMTAKTDGQVTIIATATSGTRLTLTAKAVRVPTQISFYNSSRTIRTGETYQQSAYVSDNKGELDVIPVYSSSNPSIATVDANGVVKGIAPGQVTITAKIESGNISASYKVTVVKSSSSGSQNKPTNSSTSSKKPSKTTSAKKTISKLKISRSGKTLKIKTIAKASVKVEAKKSVLGKKSKTIKSNKKGVATIKFKKKIKNVRVKITVSKSGYKTKKKTVKY